MYFDFQWREDIKARDGSWVRLRMVRRSDKAMLREGFQAMSATSRYYRFFTAKNTLTDAELHYLTELDPSNHIAIGASLPRADGHQDPMGIGRFVRLKDRPDAADAAITVIDAHQGCGLGRILLMRLCAAAWERDIRWFVCDVLPENTGMRHLVDDLFGESRQTQHAGLLQIEVPIPRIPVDALANGAHHFGALERMMHALSYDWVAMRRAWLQRG